MNYKHKLFIFCFAVVLGLVIAQCFTSFMMTYKTTAIQAHKENL